MMEVVRTTMEEEGLDIQYIASAGSSKELLC